MDDLHVVGRCVLPDDLELVFWRVLLIVIGLPAPKSSDCGLWVRASRRWTLILRMRDLPSTYTLKTTFCFLVPWNRRRSTHERQFMGAPPSGLNGLASCF